MRAWSSRIQEAIPEFPNPPGVRYSYGTAGFRTDASILTSAVFRVGVLAALRSLATGKVTGLVITASHNQVSDNGIKLVDPAGDMLAISWEPYAERIANASSSEEILKIVDEVLETEHVHTNWKGKVLVARDTRPSGQLLVSAALKGIEALEVLAMDVGVLTTPQLHWMVRATNKANAADANELSYFKSLSEAFRILQELSPRIGQLATGIEPVLVDGANGVGASKLSELQSFLGGLRLEVRNSGEGELNKSVGADFVQKERLLPIGFAPSDSGTRCVSIDGDADRLVYFYIDDPGHLHLLDGDKILALFAAFLKRQLEALEAGRSEYGPVRFGVVQTAYANGASSKYLREALGLDVVLTPTGVKYLHEEAKKLDVGVYFEANGHGTILFGERFLVFLRKAASSDRDDPGARAVTRLLAVSEMVNQAVGDAIGGLLMVEIALEYFGWGLQEWDALYSDLPSRQLKVKVRDRSLLTTTDAETRVAKPAELQQAIDKETEKYNRGRAFARPSGTEDVVRVYAEADSQESADQLAASVATAIQKYVG